MPRICLLILVCCLIASWAHGQTLVQGQVFENKTRVALAGIHVQNLNNNQQTITGNNGKFSIKASKNDLLLFKGFAYQNDTLLLVDLRFQEVFMLPEQHMLKDVKISTFEGPSMKIYDPNFHGQTTAYQTDESGNFKGGVAFRLFYWKKAEHKRNRQQKQEKQALIEQQIDKAFSIANLSKYIPLSGAELDNFIFMYKPSVRVFQDNDFNLVDYLNTCYQKFRQLPADKRQASNPNIFKTEN